jgi:hypothetical protein
MPFAAMTRLAQGQRHTALLAAQVKHFLLSLRHTNIGVIIAVTTIASGKDSHSGNSTHREDDIMFKCIFHNLPWLTEIHTIRYYKI